MARHRPFTFAPAGERPASALHRILIVGGGAGGLELAVRLGKDLGRRGRAEIVLVDPLLSHLWKPLLHEVAAGTLVVEEHGLDFLQQARRHHFRFHLGAMAGLDRQRREVRLAPIVDDNGLEIAPERHLWYDTLVIAVGSRDNDFGIPGVREHAVPLNGTNDAQAFHRRLMALFAQAEMLGRGPVKVTIVGGGATGVELAAELSDAIGVLASYGAHVRQFPQPVEISLVDNAPRLLGALPDFMGAKAEADLRERGIKLYLERRVMEVRADEVVLSDGETGERLPTDITVWAAGIRCRDFLAGLDGLESNRLNQLVVRPTLQTTRDENIFAMGDCASCVPAPGEAPVPPKAQAAHQEAKFLARALALRLQGKALPSFTFHDRGTLISLGRGKAVGNLPDPVRDRTLVAEGVLAHFSYWALYRRHLAILIGLKRAFLAILGSWFSGRVQPKVKLH